MCKVDYDDRQHLVYARARVLSAASLANWMRVFAGHAPARRPLTVLDLGSGTGRFTPALAGTFGGPVVGVEPSARMRAVAEESAAHPAVTYRAGAAEAIPLPAAAGLGVVALDRVRQRIAPTLAEWAGRLRLRGSSTFEHLTEAEIEAGFAALDADVARETTPQPVDEDGDVLVLAPG